MLRLFVVSDQLLIIASLLPRPSPSHPFVVGTLDPRNCSMDPWVLDPPKSEPEHGRSTSFGAETGIKLWNKSTMNEGSSRLIFLTGGVFGSDVW